MDLKRRTAKFIPTAQYGADITSLRHVWRQLATDLADYTGNCGSAVLTIRIPHSFVDLAGRKYPARMTSQICKNCEFMVSHRNKIAITVHSMFFQ